jgi:cytochrome b subunit of formate dehydrogenase
MPESRGTGILRRKRLQWGSNLDLLIERESRMSTTKKKSPAMKRAAQTEQVNKKALIWIGSVFAAIVVVTGVLLIWNP